MTSLLTDYRYGALRVLSFKGHLAIDALVATAFAVVPSLLGFTGLDAWYFWVNAAAVFAVVALSTPSEASEPSPSHA